jgi:hypothetical protein
MRKLCLETLIITINYYSVYLFNTPQHAANRFHRYPNAICKLSNKTMHFFLKHLENLVVQTFYRTQSFGFLFVIISVICNHYAFCDICTNSFFDTEFCCLLLGSFTIPKIRTNIPR